MSLIELRYFPNHLQRISYCCWVKQSIWNRPFLASRYCGCFQIYRPAVSHENCWKMARPKSQILTYMYTYVCIHIYVNNDKYNSAIYIYIYTCYSLSASLGGGHRKKKTHVGTLFSRLLKSVRFSNTCKYRLHKQPSKNTLPLPPTSQNKPRNSQPNSPERKTIRSSLTSKKSSTEWTQNVCEIPSITLESWSKQKSSEIISFSSGWNPIHSHKVPRPPP